ncbi:MAG: hypothetical protein WA082_02280 [Candidatus Moraniibacteriota bacterium]
MDRKSKLIFWIFFVSLAFVITLLFAKFYILRDYTLKAEVECDPQTEICFERLCMEECEQDALPEYYKIQMVQASDVSLCDPHWQECPEIDCSSVASCFEEYCSEENVPDEESCSNPEDFLTADLLEESVDEAPEVSSESPETEEDSDSDEIIE